MRRLTLFALSAVLTLSAQNRHIILITIDGGMAANLEDETIPLPNIRSLIRTGVWADSSESVFPSSTHPSHATLITGVMPLRHGVLENALFHRATGEVSPPNSLLHSQVYLVKTIFDAAKAQGLSTAGIFWPESIEDPALDFDLTIRTEGSSRHLQQNPWMQELRTHGVPVDLLDRIQSGIVSPAAVDLVSTLAACDLIDNHKPDLIALHLVNPDSEQHQYGPGHANARAALTEADTQIGAILAAAKHAGILEQTTFIVTADHGFAAVHYELNIRPYFAHAGLSGKIRVYGAGWSPFIRLLPGFEEKTDGPRLRLAFDEMLKNPHILRIFYSDQYPTLGLPRYEDSDRIPGQYLVVADIDTYLVEAQDDSVALRRRERPAYSHGYLPQYPAMYPMLVLSGNGVRKGIRIGHVRSIDVAPTIFSLLHLKALPFEGRILSEALEP